MSDETVDKADKATHSSASFDASWLVVAGIGVVAVGLGAVIVMRTRTHSLNLLDAPKGSKASPKTTPGRAAFFRVLTQGIRDGELQYLRTGMRSMLYFHKAFNDAKLLGISPTELAVSGRYFGEEILPIRIEVYDDGKVHLADGRHRYMAAQQACAHAILADVVLYDREGDVVMERRAAVTLL
jgi:hypothetical protein